MLNTINGIGKVLRAIGLNPFRINSDQILKQAIKKASFNGEVPHSVIEGLNVLCDSINREARPNPFGELAVKGLLQRTLYGRLMVEQHLAANPEIEESEEIREPIFIIGMPRTGTTILHALMHEDPQHRSPLAWECLLPYPVPLPDNYHDNPQLNTVKKEFEQLFKLVPDFLQKHYMAADSPQECIGINALDFNTFQISAQLFVPTYMEWFANGADRLGTMRWHKRFLQYLQSGGVKGARWLLKSPVHLMRLPELFEVYPDAKVIMTHRTAQKVVPSATSLISSVRSLYSDHEDPHRSGAEQNETWSTYFDRFLDARKKLDKEDQIVDLLFEDFVKDQVGVVKSIYDRFGWEYSDDTLRRFNNFLTENPKDKHGVHSYSLSDFGLNPEQIDTKFKNYSTFLASLTHELPK